MEKFAHVLCQSRAIKCSATSSRTSNGSANAGEVSLEGGSYAAGEDQCGFFTPSLEREIAYGWFDGVFGHGVDGAGSVVVLRDVESMYEDWLRGRKTINAADHLLSLTLDLRTCAKRGLRGSRTRLSWGAFQKWA
jgi:hypothetical protein